ncbi:MFS transporter [Candidatus Bathyarchaeota archaeon]|nr:MFS transporter [Candidatus Bathyarchaeota archaeon]
MNRNEFLNLRLVIFIVTLTSFLTPFNSSSFNIALPNISKEFNLDAISMSWASSAFLLTSAIFLVPFGRIADIYGRKKIFFIGTIFFGISSMFLGIYPSASYLIFLRAFQGFSSAMIFGTGIAILVSQSPTESKGSILGINAASVYIGLSTGPYIGGVLTQMFGWRSILYTIAMVSFLSSLLILFFLKGEWREAAGEKFDLFGSIIYGLTLFLLMYGFSLLPSIESVTPIVFGIISFFYFIKFELNCEYPLMDIRLFLKNQFFALGNFTALISFASTFAVTFLLSLYLQYLKGLSPQDAGLILMSSPIIQAIIAPLSGRLSDKKEPRKIAALGMGFSSLGLGSLIFINESSSTIQIVLSLCIIGLGLALFGAPNTNLIMSSVEKRFFGIASSTLGTMRLLGQTLSQSVAMMIFAIYLGRTIITPQIYSQLEVAIQVSFILFFIFSIIGIIASLMNSKKN